MIKLLFLNAVRNIRRNTLRSMLSAVIIGMMVMFFVVLNTITGLFTNEFTRTMMHYDIVVQSRFSNSPLSSHIKREVFEQLKRDHFFSNVDAVSISRFNINRNRLWILGISDFGVFASKFGVLIRNGRAYEKGRLEMIAGNKAVPVLGHSLGESMQFGNSDAFKITGLFSSFFSLLNGAVIMDLDTAKRLSTTKGSVNMILLSVKKGRNLEQTQAQIHRRFPDVVALKTERIGKTMTSLRDISKVTGLLSWLVFATAAIAILNTLLITTLHRTREIGILLAVGWPKSMIVAIFLVESLLLSAVASALGLLFSGPILWAIKTYTSLTIYIPDTIAPAVMAQVLAMAFSVGLIGVLAPMYYVFRVTVSKALRYE